MPFRRDSQGFYHPLLLSPFPQLFAVFGTRAAAMFPEELATVHQIHSADVVQVNRTGPAGDGDALITNTPGVTLAIKTADCLPILMADIHHHAVAAVHAGWRGTAKKIGPQAVRAMRDAFGTKPEELRVVLGPAIGPCCFEVGPDVARELGVDAGGKVKLDLSRMNRDQLEEAGVAPGSIEEANLCTFCRGEDFFSFRREREDAGRMVSAIGIRP